MLDFLKNKKRSEKFQFISFQFKYFLNFQKVTVIFKLKSNKLANIKMPVT